ncbi:MAG: DUF5688 family protein [Lachnospiraceae bacterium]
MNYEQFAEALQQCVTEKMRPGIRVEMQKITKNNGVVLTGLAFCMENGIAPLIYLEEFYEEYRRGASLGSIAEEVIYYFENCRIPDNWSSQWFMDFEKVKERVVMKLVNTEKNTELLKKIPNLPFFDLSVIFYVLLPDGEDSACIVLIQNAYLDHWKIPLTVLYEYAKKNTPKLCPVRFCSMHDLLRNLSEEEEEMPLYVLTNKSGVNGAAAILYEGVLSQIHQQFSENFYLLPSSVHEFLLLPEQFAGEKIRLKEMVKAVNETQLEEEEILSNEVYYYNGACLSLCDS